MTTQFNRDQTSRSRLSVLARLLLSKEVVLLLVGSGTTLLGAYLGQISQRHAQEIQITATNRERVQLAATAAFDELSLAANGITRSEQQVFASAEGDPTAPPLGNALWEMDSAAVAWRRDVPRLQALGRAYFCYSGYMLIESTDKMLDHYLDVVQEFSQRTQTGRLERLRELTRSERDAWRDRVRSYRTHFSQGRNPMDNQVLVNTTFERWMVEALRNGIAGRDTTNCS